MKSLTNSRREAVKSLNIYNTFKLIIMSNSIELRGRIKSISDAETIQTKNGDMEKRVVALTLGADSNYPVDYPIEVMGPKANIFSAYKPNDEVSISVNLRSYTDKNGNLRSGNPTAWRVTYADGSIPNTTSHETKVESFVNQGDSELTF